MTIIANSCGESDGRAFVRLFQVNSAILILMIPGIIWLFHYYAETSEFWCLFDSIKVGVPHNTLMKLQNHIITDVNGQIETAIELIISKDATTATACFAVPTTFELIRHALPTIY